MCIGIPMRILSSDGIAARAANPEREEDIDLSLTGPLAPGTWVLVFLGAARETLTEAEARLILDALDGLRAVMAGGDPGGAFRDIEAAGPQLPPHLRAAAEAGRTVA